MQTKQTLSIENGSVQQVEEEDSTRHKWANLHDQ